MVSGSIILKNSNIDNDSLKSLKWEREEDERIVKDVIQINDSKFKFGTNDYASSALGIHEYVGLNEQLVESDGIYSVESSKIVKVKWARLLLTDTFVVVDKKSNRPFVREIITNGLGLGKTELTDLVLNTKQISDSKNNQWIRCFENRRGKVNRGRIYGDGIEKDPTFKPILEKSNTNATGYPTKFFGEETKVKITPDGSVTIYDDVGHSDFLKFIQKEVLPYKISRF